MGGPFLGVLNIRAIPFGVFIRAPDFWKLLFGFGECNSVEARKSEYDHPPRQSLEKKKKQPKSS